MGIGDSIGGIYSKMEDAFFGFCDALDSKGIPIYGLVDALEGKGIPAFPAFVGIIALIVAVVAGVFFLLPGTISFQPSFLDDADSATLNSVQVTISLGDKLLESQTMNSGETLALSGVSVGQSLTVSMSKTGFENSTETVAVSSNTISPTFRLSKKLTIVSAKLQVVDRDTLTPIENAHATVTVQGSPVSGYSDSNGMITFASVPRNIPLSISITASGYEDSTQTITFLDGIRTIQMAPDGISLEGLSDITIRVLDADGNLIKNAQVVLKNKTNASELTNAPAPTGEYSIPVQNGTVLQWIVSKDGFATYDSSIEGDNLTVRQDETIEVILSPGGQDVVVYVYAGNNLVNDATVTLYNALGEPLDENSTEFGGFVEFKDLNVGDYFYVGAWKENFLPTVEMFSPKDKQTISLTLEQVSSANSASVSIYVSQENENPLPGAIVQFFSLDANDHITPLGIPAQETDLVGYAGTIAPLVNLYVTASKDALYGDANKVLLAGTVNRIDITAYAPSTIVTLYIVDAMGNPIDEGSVLITSQSGMTLFDGNIDMGKVMFDALGNEVVNVVITAGGETWEESVNVKGLREKTIVFGKASTDKFAPQLEFVRFEDADGKTVKGIASGKDGFAVFKVVWPAGADKGGIHLRAGSDETTHVESQNAGILGFQGTANSFFYGRTYTPNPAPGNEAIDFQNSGIEGTYNKFLELYYNNPSGAQTFKVRVKVRENTSSGEIELHYRAWSQAGGYYYRSPSDPILLQSAYADERSALYAETSVQPLAVLDGKIACNESACVSLQFVDSLGNEYDPQKFSAAANELYAVQVSVQSATEKEVSLTATTSTSKAIGFTGQEVEPFSNSFPDSNGQSASTLNLISNKDSVQGRFYFKTLKAEQTFVKISASVDNNSFAQTVYFNISAQNLMHATIDPQTPLQGETFSIFIQSDSNEAVKEATLRFKNAQGVEEKTIIGNNTSGKGKAGRYSVKGNLKAGNYSVEISAQGYKTFSLPLSIAQSGVLVLPDSISILLDKSTKSGTAKLEIRNAGKETVNDLVLEQVTDEVIPFNLSFAAPSSLAAGASQSIELSAEYSGDENRDHGEIQLFARGTIAGVSTVAATTRVLLEYNKEFDSSCLSFSPSSASVSLLAEEGVTKQIPITVKNNCTIQVQLVPEVKAQGSKDDALEVSAQELGLLPGEEGTTQITVSNSINRTGYEDASFSYIVYYKSDSLTKSIPVTISLVHRRLYLQVSDNIQLFLTQFESSQRAYQAKPLNIRNASNTSIQNITFQKSSAYAQTNSYGDGINSLYGNGTGAYAYTGYNLYTLYGSNSQYSNLQGNQIVESIPGVDVYIEPSSGIPILRANESAIPVPAVIAQGSVQKSTVARQVFTISGTVDGKTVALRSVNVWVYASSPSCLKITNPKIEYASEIVGPNAADTKTISLTNNCIGPVQISAVRASDAILQQLLGIAPSSGFAMYVGVGQTASINLIASKAQEVSRNGTVQIFGVISSTGQAVLTDTVPISIKFGKGASGTKGIVGVKGKVPICDSPGQFMDVEFPKLATGDDCSSGYCDADSATKYLAKKINQKVEDLENKIAQLNKSALSCSSPYA
ncbi:MAG: hypothetical protein V1977_01940, partial [Candidatus Diapherotrites archaeon]